MTIDPAPRLKMMLKRHIAAYLLPFPFFVYILKIVTIKVINMIQYYYFVTKNKFPRQKSAAIRCFLQQECLVLIWLIPGMDSRMVL